MQKMGLFGVLRGHSRSWAMSPFDRAVRAHTTSYSTLIESMRLSCIVFEIQRAQIKTYIHKITAEYKEMNTKIHTHTHSHTKL